jgi:D-mannonate dehydratase
MKKTWRWLGKIDPITLEMLKQIGVEKFVTALHYIPNGDIWTYEAIMEVKNSIENYRLHWSVVESLPVSEAIKYSGAGGNCIFNFCSYISISYTCKINWVPDFSPSNYLLSKEQLKN